MCYRKQAQQLDSLPHYNLPHQDDWQINHCTKHPSSRTNPEDLILCVANKNASSHPGQRHFKQKQLSTTRKCREHRRNTYPWDSKEETFENRESRNTMKERQPALSSSLFSSAAWLKKKFFTKLGYNEITLYVLMNSFFWFDAIDFWWSIVYTAVTSYNFHIKIYFFRWRLFLS